MSEERIAKFVKIYPPDEEHRFGQAELVFTLPNTEQEQAVTFPDLSNTVVVGGELYNRNARKACLPENEGIQEVLVPYGYSCTKGESYIVRMQDGKCAIAYVTNTSTHFSLHCIKPRFKGYDVSIFQEPFSPVVEEAFFLNGGLSCDNPTIFYDYLAGENCCGIPIATTVCLQTGKSELNLTQHYVFSRTREEILSAIANKEDISQYYQCTYGLSGEITVSADKERMFVHSLQGDLLGTDVLFLKAVREKNRGLKYNPLWYVVRRKETCS